LAGHFSGYDIDAYPGTLEAAASAALSFSLAMLPAKFETFTMVSDWQMTADRTRTDFNKKINKMLKSIRLSIIF
jgi:hypothetical protein